MSVQARRRRREAQNFAPTMYAGINLWHDAAVQQSFPNGSTISDLVGLIRNAADFDMFNNVLGEFPSHVDSDGAGNINNNRVWSFDGVNDYNTYVVGGSGPFESVPLDFKRDERFHVFICYRQNDGVGNALYNKQDNTANLRGFKIRNTGGAPPFFEIALISVAAANEIGYQAFLPSNLVPNILEVRYDGSETEAGFDVLVDGVDIPNLVVTDNLSTSVANVVDGETSRGNTGADFGDMDVLAYVVFLGLNSSDILLDEQAYRVRRWLSARANISITDGPV